MTSKFYSAPFKDEHGQGMSLRFIDQPISRAIFTRFESVCKKNIEFGEIDAEQLLVLLRDARVDLTGASDAPSARQGLDIFQAQSIRRHVIRQYNITNSHRVANEMRAIAQKYESGESILTISRAIRLSPYIIFRALMEHLHGAEMRDKINLVSLGKVRAADVFDERTAREYDDVREYDFESVAVQMRMAHAADTRESNFIAFLRDELGIALKTQADLYEAATRAHVQPVTPDALFTSPVVINGVRVHWIDFKAYCGTPISFLARSVRAQHDKYVRAFGPGFIVYEHGFAEPIEYSAVSARALRDIIEKGLTRAILV
jgi:hypothetical protein